MKSTLFYDSLHISVGIFFVMVTDCSRKLHAKCAEEPKEEVST